MHEMSLTEGVMQIVEDHAKKAGFARATVVRLEIGDLSQVDPQAMLFCFDAVAATSPVLQGARLEIARVPGQAFCMNCVETVPLSARGEPCPACGSYKLQITAGDEMRVKELEVE